VNLLRRSGFFIRRRGLDLGKREMKRNDGIDQLGEIQEIADIEVAHRLADDILCRLLQSLGYADVVAEYNKVGKWFGSW
jgi:hypothetical protein